MTFTELMEHFFVSLTSSISIEIEPSHLRVSRRRDGVVEDCCEFTGEEKEQFLQTLYEALNTTPENLLDYRQFILPGKDHVFDSTGVSFSDRDILTIKRLRHGIPKPLSECAVSDEEADSIKRIMTPPEGVVLISSPLGHLVTIECIRLWYHTFGEDSRLWSTQVRDFPCSNIPGLPQCIVNSAFPETVREALNKMRFMQRVPVVLSLLDETLAVKEAFRIAQTDFQPHVLTDSRPVVDTFLWLKKLINPWVLSEYLSGVISTISFPGICPHCKEKDPSPDPTLLRRVGISIEEAQKLMRGRGCDKCHNSGYTRAERKLALEIVNVRDNDELAAMLKEPVDENELMQPVEAARGPTFQDKTRALLLAGHIDLEHAEYYGFRRRVNM